MAFFLMADSLSFASLGTGSQPGRESVNMESRKVPKLELVSSDHIDVGGRL
jgi:hypothetical protein